MIQIVSFFYFILLYFGDTNDSNSSFMHTCDFIQNKRWTLVLANPWNN